jgi:hypothetical protein
MCSEVFSMSMSECAAMDEAQREDALSEEHANDENPRTRTSWKYGMKKAVLEKA